jgi:hypothetical protein
MNNLLVQVSRQLRRHGWALLCSEIKGHPYQFTLGLTARLGHPELEVIGLEPAMGQDLLAELVRRIKGGQRLEAGDFFSDLKRGYDFFLVDNPIDPDGPPLTGNRLRLIWPDAQHRYPWHADCDPYCEAQGLLLEPDGMDVEGLAKLLSFTNAAP